MVTRRHFVKRSALTGAGLSTLPDLTFEISNNIKGDSLRLSFISIELRVTNYLRNTLQRKDTEVTAICDIDSKRIPIVLKIIEKAYKKSLLTINYNLKSNYY